MNALSLNFFDGRSNGATMLRRYEDTLGNWDRALVRTDLTHDEVAVVSRMRNCTLGHIADIKAAIADLEVRRAAAVATRKPTQTAAAIANPTATCTRCDGVGKIRGFSHVEGGACFACNGKGVRWGRRA